MDGDVVKWISKTEAHYLGPQLEYQRGAPLVVRHLLASSQTSSGLSRVRAKGSERESGLGPMRRPVRSSRAEITCHGSIFGVLLGNLVHHAVGNQTVEGRKFTVARVMHKLVTELDPAGQAMGRSTGSDVTHLVRGLAQHRIVGRQLKMLVKNRELAIAPRIRAEQGHMSVAVGATAALLVVYSTIATDTVAVRDLGSVLWEQFTARIQHVLALLMRWRLVITEDAGQDALEAEQRALERAQVAVERAQNLATARSLEPVEAFALQLLHYRRAAWPSGQVLNPETHPQLLTQMRAGVLLDQEQEGIRTRVAPIPTPGVLSLSALPLGDLDDSGDSGSYTTSASSWSSVSSCAGDEVRIPSLSSMRTVSSASDLVQRLGIL